MSHLRLLIISLVLSSNAGFSSTNPPPCEGGGSSAHCMCEVEKLRPTQVSLGALHVQDILRKSPVELQERAVDKPIVVVIGPDRTLYVTDGHHHARAILEQFRLGIGPAVTIYRIDEDDTSGAPLERMQFLDWLAARSKARLNGGDDVNGEVRPGLFPPQSLADMTNDSYRSLANFVEHGCEFKMKGDFGEFPLADLMRKAGVKAPTELAKKRAQGRRAAAELVANLDAKSRPVFEAIPNHEEISRCAGQTR